jgi:three-Cys-motif partner protein
MTKAYDEIHYWSEVKLDIVREYAAAYSRILSAQAKPSLRHLYIDAFAGSGLHLSKSTGGFVTGSPLNALLVNPPFREYHFIDMNSGKADLLRTLTQGRSDVTVYDGDCNHLLTQKVFCRASYKSYCRALCLLDPYGLHLDWSVIATAGQSQSIEIFLNFPVADMNRNVLWHCPAKVDARQVARMNAFWGDESWRQAAYDTSRNLFGWEEKTDNTAVVNAFQQRLKTVAGFKYVPEPIPMRNSKNAVVYYLFFASQKPVASQIVEHIFDKYRDKGVPQNGDEVRH